MGDVVERVVRKNTNNESSLPLTISAQYGLVDQITYFNNRVASKDLSNYYLVYNGEFAYNKSTSDGFPFGAVKRLDLYEKGVLSTLYIVFSIKAPEEIDSNYLAVFFDTDRWHKGVSERAAEGARNHGLLNISAEDFFEIEVSLPRLQREQQSISTFFRHLDNLIAHHQCKYTKIVNIKKAMLEKMFPKDGAPVPEIRFSGFTDAWEQRKLGEVATLLTGFPFESKKFTDNGIKLIRGMNVKRGYLDFSDGLCEHWASPDGLENYLLKSGDILIQMDGALIGTSYAKIAENQLPALLVQRVTRARVLTDKADGTFIYQEIQKGFLPYIKGTKTETAVPHLSLNDITDFPIAIPSINEQKKIGTYFENLDRLITLHQRELERLQNIKKSCLEKMFV